MKFHHVRVDHIGNPIGSQLYDAGKLARGAVSTFATVLQRHRKSRKSDFVQPIAGADGRKLSFRLTAEKYAAAVVTFFSGDVPLMMSSYLKGTDRAADEYALVSLRNLISLLPGDAPIDLQFDQPGMSERPAVITVTLPVPAELDGDQKTASNWNVCCAAAFFALAPIPSAPGDKTSGSGETSVDSNGKNADSGDQRVDGSAA